VITNVDYCSSTLAGVSGALLQRLQSVFNAAARLVFSARRSEHITPLLRELHWLKVPERIGLQFRLCVLTLNPQGQRVICPGTSKSTGANIPLCPGTLLAIDRNYLLQFLLVVACFLVIK